MTIEVQTTSREYPVLIGSGILDDESFWSAQIGQRRVAIVSNQTIAPLYLAKLKSAMGAARGEPLTVLLEDGEAHKNWSSLSSIFDALLLAQCDRDTVLVALGGGVIGDLTGFAAATYQRGIDFIQVPTTLLAQVDSSVGGKTGINHPAGKNMIGAFHQPCAVLADIGTLHSLPARQLRAGLAEVIKHGAIADAALFRYLEQNITALVQGDASGLAHVVQASVHIKAGIVGADERESGLRALLNFGHTFGHAIEAGLGYGQWLHGEAVAAGMVLAARLSHHLGSLSEVALARIEALITASGLPHVAPEFAVNRWIELMAVDKKARSGSMRFIVLDAIGAARVVALNEGEVRRFFQTQTGLAA